MKSERTDWVGLWGAGSKFQPQSRVNSRLRVNEIRRTKEGCRRFSKPLSASSLPSILLLQLLFSRWEGNSPLFQHVWFLWHLLCVCVITKILKVILVMYDAQYMLSTFRIFRSDKYWNIASWQNIYFSSSFAFLLPLERYLYFPF